MTLMAGTGLAQALPIAVAPVLTRLYSPEDFGLFALYTSVCVIAAAVATGKYELAIVVPKGSSEAVNLAVLTALVSLVTSLVLLIAVLALDGPLAALFNQPAIKPWLYLMPVTVLLVGCYQALNVWTNRVARYKAMATSRITQSGAAVAGQLAAGWAKAGSAGLIGGQLLGQAASLLALVVALPGAERRLLRQVSVKRMLMVARKHAEYPKYIVPSQTMSVVATELPLLLLTTLFGAGVAGLYSLAQRVMGAPLSLVAGAVGDVYRQKAAEDYARQGECRTLFLSSLKRLAFFAMFPMLPVLLLGPSLFAFVFGESWRGAGEVAALLAVMGFFQTVSSPLSTTVLLAGWMRFEFLWQLTRLGMTALVFWTAQRWGLGYLMAVAAHVAVFSGLYLVHSAAQYRAASRVAQREVASSP